MRALLLPNDMAPRPPPPPCIWRMKKIHTPIRSSIGNQDTRTPSSEGMLSSIGAAVILVGTVTWSFGSLYTRQGHLPASPVLAIGMEMLAGGAYYEFIELANTSARPIELAGVQLTAIDEGGSSEGVQFQFLAAPVRALGGGYAFTVPFGSGAGCGSCTSFPSSPAGSAFLLCTPFLDNAQGCVQDHYGENRRRFNEFS